MLIVTFLFVNSISALVVTRGRRYPYAGLNTDEIIRAAGYPCEVHKIQTEDGFILTAFRIPYGKGHEPGPRPSFWLQHGLVGSSDQFVHLGPQGALSFLLSDKGYDVWIGNARGNIYSQEHVNYTLKDPRFWDFSFDEMGYYDIPAAVSHVINLTKQKKMLYAGHSMGATMMMVTLSTRPQFQDKIEMVFALGPGVYMGHSRSVVLSLFCVFSGILLNDIFGPGPAFPKIFFQIQNSLWPLCSSEFKTSIVCKRIYEITFGPSTDISMEMVTNFMSSSPTQASTRTAAHYLQIIESGEFHAFDFGEEANMKRYGSAIPLMYNLKSIATPVAIMYSDSDYIVTSEDEYDFCTNLQNVVYYYKIPHQFFNHMDFLYGQSAIQLVYNKIFEVLEKKTNSTSSKSCLFK